MLAITPNRHACRASDSHWLRRFWSKSLLIGVILVGTSGCSYFCKCDSSQNSEQTTAESSDKTSYVNNTSDASSRRSTSESSRSIDTTASVPVSTSAPTPPPVAPVVGTDSTATQPGAASPSATGAPKTAPNNTNAKQQGQLSCPEPMNNHYKKSVAFVSFPRNTPSASKLGGLHNVEQHLPELLGSDLHNHHSMLALTYLRGSLASASVRGEINAATQAQALSKQHRVQFLVSGEIDDMGLRFPDTVENPGFYTRFINGTHNLFHINTPLDKRYRAFSFLVEVRDGFTGHIVFSNRYHTFGKWKAALTEQVGFGTPEFWETDYGNQVQQLIAHASDEMAKVLNCQPYIARVDATPGQQQIVIHSGNSNGLHSGDTLDLYQLVFQPITGEYQRSDTRLVKRTGRVQLIETYPSHSIGNVLDETLLGGQYVVKAR